MANPHKGEIVMQAGGVDYTLRFSIDSICEMERATGKSVIALSSDLGDPAKLSMGLLRSVLWAGLRDKHPDLDPKAAGELILSAGGMSVVMGKIGEALAAAFPSDETGGADSPPKPGQDQSGTGSASTPTGSSSG